MHATDSIHLHLSITPGTVHSIPSGCQLNFLTKEDTVAHNETQYITSRRLKRLYMIEAKGTFESDWSFDLLPTNCFWLYFQFIGHSQRNSMQHTALSHNEYQGFHSAGLHTHRIQLRAGKTWFVLLGIKTKDITDFTAEWPLLAKPSAISQPYFSSINIGYRIKQVFEKIQQYEPLPFSLYSKISCHLCELISIYHQDLKDKERLQQKEDIVIYHEAKEYISEHYMDEGINRDTIADHLGIGVRKLYRVFKDNGLTIHGAIQTIRLYKARELLRETDDPVDIIAFHLNFSTAKYFYRQYVKWFGHSPSKERELHQKSKKKRRKYQPKD